MADEDDPQPDPLSEALRRERDRFQSVTNKIEGLTYISGATLGFVGASGGATRTGTLAAAEVDNAVRAFLPPAPFETAGATLDERHFVVLFGRPRIGKRSGALALLREALPEGDIIGLSPTRATERLAEYPFREGTGYVVFDRSFVITNESEEEFHWQDISRRLIAVGAFLVVTTSARVGLPTRPEGVVVTWQPPDPVTLFRQALADAGVDLDDSARARLEQAVAQDGCPGTVVELAHRARDGVETALGSIDTIQRDVVVTWIDGIGTEHEQLIAIIALAFLHGLPEPEFAQWSSALSAEFRAREPKTDSETRDRRFEQSHVRLLLAGQVIGVQRVAQEASSTVGPHGSLVFANVAHRRLLLQELHARFGVNFWDAVHAWVESVARAGAFETRIQLALGLTMLAESGADTWVDRLLHRWSAGASEEQLTAFFAVSWMADFDEAAAHGLGLVVGWAHDHDLRRRLTASIALGGRLGSTYPEEAQRQLWHLARQGEPLRASALMSMGCLFADAQSRRAGSELARFVCRRITTPHRWSRRDDVVRERELIADAVLTLLDARTTESDEPAVTVHLRDCEDDAEVLGRLVGWALVRKPSRAATRRGLRALCDPEHWDPVLVRLAAGVEAALPAVERPLLEREITWLRQGLADRDRPRRSSPAQLTAATRS